jgi:hypothetical protein
MTFVFTGVTRLWAIATGELSLFVRYRYRQHFVDCEAQALALLLLM